MTRVSSFGHQQTMLTSMLKNQEKVFTSDLVATTGKKEQEYKGLATQTNTLLGAKTVLTRSQTYINAAEHVGRQLRTNDLQVNAMVQNAENVRDAVLDGIAMDETFALNDVLGQAFSSMISALNTKIGGVYIFAGAKSDVPPVTAQDISDLIAAPTAADLFRNDGRRAVAEVGQGTSMEYGLLANEVGEDIFAAFKNIADFNAGPGGPLEGKLTAAQRSFLEGELATLDAGIDKMRLFVARNGTRQENLEGLLLERQDEERFLEIFISDIEDADLARAATELEINQIALQVSYQVTAQLSRLSLLNFL